MSLPENHWIFLVTIILMLILSSANAQQPVDSALQDATQIQTSSSLIYNPSLPQLGLQFGSGALFGAAGGIGAGLAGIAIFVPNTDGPGAGFVALGVGALGFIIGYPAGSSLGIYLAANSDTYDASFGNILLGSFLGAGAGIGLLVLANDAYAGDPPASISLILGLSLPVIGGMVANAMSIDRRNNNHSALLNITKDNADLSFPAVQLTKIGNYNFANKHFSDSYSPTVKLLNISL